MQTVGIIPARYASTRFPGKPLALIGGKPMIQHVTERASKASRLNRLVVATDDRRILEAVRAFGSEALLTREDHPTGTDRLAEAAALLALADDDIVVNIQGDEPLVEASMIDALIEALLSPPECPMATLAFQTQNTEHYHSPHVVKVVTDTSGRALYFSRSPLPFHRDHEAETPLFLKHMGFYAYRHRFLQSFTHLPPGRLEAMEKLEQLRALENGHAIRVALSARDTLGVDTPGDLERLLQHPDWR